VGEDRRAEVVDLPVAIEPVRPMRSMVAGLLPDICGERGPVATPGRRGEKLAGRVVQQVHAGILDFQCMVLG